jgi:hypothetical protein
MACVCGACIDCRLERKRRHARDRQARRRAAVQYADELPPLLAMMLYFTEQADWIDRKLAAEDDLRRNARPASRC